MTMPHARIDVESAREAAEDASLQLWTLLCATMGKIGGETAEGEGGDVFGGYPLSLPCRCTLQADRGEFSCRTTGVSPIGISVTGLAEGREGAGVTAKIRHIGTVDGVIVRAGASSRVIGVLGTPARLESLAQRIGWRLRRASENLPDRRAHERIEGSHRNVSLQTLDGRALLCQVLDTSAGGAALHLGKAALYLWVNQPVIVDGRYAYVLRRFPEGIVVKFDEDGKADPALARETP